MVATSLGIAFSLVVEFEAKEFSLVERACLLDQRLSKIGVDAPVADLIGVGESVARDGAANPHVIEFLRCVAKARFDVSETFSISELSKGQSQKLIPAGKTVDLVVAVVALNATAKLISGGYEVHQLNENRFARIHRRTAN